MAVSLEERVAAIEIELERLKEQTLCLPPPAVIPWWEKVRGAFKDDPVYDEIARLGAEWRQSQPIAADDLDSANADSLHS